jgi:hypothetical protein
MIILRPLKALHESAVLYRSQYSRSNKKLRITIDLDIDEMLQSLDKNDIARYRLTDLVYDSDSREKIAGIISEEFRDTAQSLAINEGHTLAALLSTGLPKR